MNTNTKGLLEQAKAALQAEIDELSVMLKALEQGGDTVSVAPKAKKGPGSGRGRQPFTTAQKAEASKRMRLFWQNRKKGKSAKTTAKTASVPKAKVGRRTFTKAQKAEAAARMKAYWEQKRAAAPAKKANGKPKKAKMAFQVEQAAIPPTV